MEQLKNSEVNKSQTKVKNSEMETTIQYKNHTIHIERDTTPESPREWENLGTMVCFHKRYNLGDKHDYNHDDYSGWGEFQKHLENSGNIVLPMFMYDHSGQTIATIPFSCPWDSGQIGFIIAKREKIRKHFNWSRISPKRADEVRKYLSGEVDIYNDYISGEVYGYRVENSEENELDSCWGYFGDPEKSGCIDEAKSQIDWHVEND